MLVFCRIVKLSDKLTQDSAFYAKEAQSLGVPFEAYQPGAFDNDNVIVVCLLVTAELFME